MINKFLPILIILFICSFLNANQKENILRKNSAAAVKSSTSKPIISMPAGKYKLKSGVVYIDIENSMFQGKTKAVLYFDNYGNKECTETSMDMEMMGQKIKVHQLVMFVDGYMYTIDLEKKTGMKMKLSSNQDPTKFDYENLTPEMMKEYNIKKEGTESILGKKCDIYSMNSSKMNMKGKVWVWNGINMKSDVEMSGLKVKTTTTKIEENASVPSSRFVIPNGIKFQQM